MAKPARELAMELLLKGIPAEEVALTIGTDVSYIIGLQNDPTFHNKLVNGRTERVVETYDRDSSIDSLETIALSRLVDVLPTETNTRVLIQAFNTLNGAKRRSKGEQRQQAGNTVVELHLPAFINENKVAFQKDQQGQVVAIDGRVLQTIDTKTLLKEASEDSASIREIVENRETMESISVDDL